MQANRRSGGRQRAEGTLRFRTGFRNTIYDVLRRRGWKETESDLEWDLHWADREWVYEVFDNIHLDHWQRVNHYRNGRELCRKDLLIKNVKRMKKQLEREGKKEEAAQYDFCPITFVLPGDYALFVEEFKKHSGGAWIMKPIGKAQGKGIFLFQKLSQISDWRTDYRWKPDNPSVESYVVQRYIGNPYLVGGRKFDMRVYTLVTSFQPLVIYLYRNGFARFSSTRYSNESITNAYVHLTNVAIQKSSNTYNEETGGKWDLRRMKMFLFSRHGKARVDALFEEMQNIMIRSLMAVQKIMINDKHCFELYGYDLMFDDNLKPWLIEVNASPSLTANTPSDYNMKFKMLNDVMDVIDLEGRTSGKEHHIGGFDLIWNNGPIASDKTSEYKSLLGADFDRRVNVFKPKSRRDDSGGSGAGSGAGASSARGRTPTSSRTGRKSGRPNSSRDDDHRPNSSTTSAK